MEEEYFFSTGEFPKTISEKRVQVMDGLADAVVKTVKVSEIFPDPEKPPKKYPEDELAKLAIDILSNGLKNPLTVAPSKPAKRERYRILSGEKRFRAYRKSSVYNYSPQKAKGYRKRAHYAAKKLF